MSLEFQLPGFDLSVHSPPADFVASWRDEEFVARACNGILHFRSRERNESHWTFAVGDPMPRDVEEMPEIWPLWWKDAMASENLARFIVYPYRSSFKRDFPFYLRFDGRGWMREIWNRDDCLFENGFSPTLAQWGDERDLREGIEQIFIRVVYPWLEEQPTPHPQANEAVIEWLCGSPGELERVARAICAQEPAFAQRNTKLWFACENAWSRALLWGADDLFQRSRREMGYGEVRLSDPRVQISSAFWALIELALDYNTPTGLYWEYHDVGSGRAAYSPHGPWFQVKISKPSHHERLEARLFLRDWLRDKLPPAEVKTLLP